MVVSTCVSVSIRFARRLKNQRRSVYQVSPALKTAPYPWSFAYDAPCSAFAVSK